MRNAVLFSLVPLALVAACTKVENGAPATADEAAVLDAIHAVENAQIAAVNAKDAAGGSAPYAADATLYLPDSDPISGSEAIAASFADGLKDPAYAVTADEGSNKAWVAASGDLATTSFTGTWTHTVDGKPKTVRLVNQTVWKKQDDDSWKIVSDLNATLPGEPAAPASPEPAASASPAPAASTSASPAATPTPE